MNKLRILNLLTLTAAFLLFSSYKEIDKNEAIMQVMMQGLENVHYQPQVLNDQFSARVYDLYLKRLDVSKKFLLQEDINILNKYRNQLDEEVKAGSYEFFKLSTEIINKRVKEAEAYYKEILANPFDYKKDESVELDYKKLPFAADKAALKESWRKYLKYQALIRLNEKMDAQERIKEGKDSSGKIKSFEQLEAEARNGVQKTHEDWFKRLGQVEENDRLTAYLNTIANSYDPHTEYFPPKDKENFDIALTGQLEGIGAQLQEKDGQIKVTNIVPGSASARQGQLKAGDIILKVGQGHEEPVEITDMRLDKAVELIRGKKGTEVRLTVKKPDGKMIVIPIVRDVVVLEETYAQGAVLDGKDKIGYIKLPIFYADFNKKGARSSAEDVKKELIRLKKENISGVILDLRNNGGGSLQDAVKMAGLFIDQGPMVQVKAREGVPLVLDDNDPEVVYDGPLVVMVNSGSASASEIVAAALQDYKRAVIVGGSSTFGKGTVQQFFNLDDYLNATFASIKPLGSVKLTTQKFYRISGGATQLKGVIPDIILPDLYSEIEFGEKEQDYAIAWDEISPAKFNKWNKAINTEKLKKNSTSRIKDNKLFSYVSNEAMELKRKKDKTLATLNLDKYRAEQKKEKAETNTYTKLEEAMPELSITPVKIDNEEIAKDTSGTKEWYKGLKKDIYLNEAVNIVKEMN